MSVPHLATASVFLTSALLEAMPLQVPPHLPSTRVTAITTVCHRPTMNDFATVTFKKDATYLFLFCFSQSRSCPSCFQNSSTRTIASKIHVLCSFRPACSLHFPSLQGLAFHPTQPLLAAALHNGSVQLWNYRVGVLVDRFEEHQGDLSLAQQRRPTLLISFDKVLFVELPSILAERAWSPAAMIMRSKTA